MVQQLPRFFLGAILAVAFHPGRATAEDTPPPTDGTTSPAASNTVVDASAAGAGEGMPSGLETALNKVKFPGVTLNLKERCLDVESTVCLHRGTLELVACTKGTKEHESIVVMEAKAMHVHVALLLLGAKPGNPAMQRRISEEDERWIDIPPRGEPVDVYLVVTNQEGVAVERPIRDFIAPSDIEYETPASGNESTNFPTHTFVFAGSQLWGKGPGERKYLCDESGNAISISTFGDELLCLPGFYSQDNGALMWQVNPEGLPAVGSKVTLRLRPHVAAASKTGAAEVPAAAGAP
jgi:hypothetical protein